MELFYSVRPIYENQENAQLLRAKHSLMPLRLQFACILIAGNCYEVLRILQRM